MISIKWGSFLGVLFVDSKQRISFGGTSIVYGILLGCCRDVAVSINTTYEIGCCDWILIQPSTEVNNPCVSKPTCTHVIIIWLWLICYIQCGFSVSYLSIPGMAAHDRCNISHSFTFSFQLQCRTALFIFKTTFWEDSKLGSVVGGMVEMRVYNHLFQDCFG